MISLILVFLVFVLLPTSNASSCGPGQIVSEGSCESCDPNSVPYYPSLNYTSMSPRRCYSFLDFYNVGNYNTWLGYHTSSVDAATNQEVNNNGFEDSRAMFAFPPADGTVENCALACSSGSRQWVVRDSNYLYPFAVRVEGDGTMFCYCPIPRIDKYLLEEQLQEQASQAMCNYRCPGGGTGCALPADKGSELYSIFYASDFLYNDPNGMGNKGTTCLDCSSVKLGYRRYELDGATEVPDFGTYPASVRAWLTNPMTFSHAILLSKDDDTNRCNMCTLGEMQDASGICVACPVGKKNGYEMSPWTAPDSRALSCQPCTANRYQDETGQVECKNCPNGYIYTSTALGAVEGHVNCDDPALTTKTPCDVGKYCSNNQPSDCPRGRYADTTGSAACTVCPPGKSTAAVGATSASQCVACVAGEFVSMSSSTFAENIAYECSDCPMGTYSQAGSAICTQCDQGQESAAHSTSSADCTDCLSGKYMLSVPYSNVDASLFEKHFCTSCNIGKYQPLTKQTECLSCDPGQSSPISSDEKSDCYECSKGTYELGNACTPCGAGLFSNVTGMTQQCYSCPIGSSTLLLGEPTDTFIGAVSSSNCSLCWPGYRGTTMVTNGGQARPICTVCTEGGYSAINGSSYCQDCPSGKYTLDDALKQTSCNPCPAGKKCCWWYDNDYKANNPDVCRVDNVDVNNEVARTAIESNLADCDIGTWGGLGENCAHDCPAGTVSTERGANSSAACKQCPAGFYCPGFRSISEGGTKLYQGMKKCPVGSFCPPGVVAPSRCPDGTTTRGRENAALSDCKPCARGTTRNALTGGETCNKCGPGTYAPNEGALECLECAKEFGCQEGGADCSKGYGGNLCGICAENYYESGGKCEECASSPWLTIIAVALLLLAYYFISKIELNLHHIIRIKIYSTFFQLMCLVMYVEVPWPESVKKFTQIFYTLSFNIEIAHPECHVTFNFYDKMKMVVIAPIVIGVFLGLLSKYFNYQRAINQDKDVAKSRYYRRKWKTLRQVMVIFVTAVYTPVCYYALRMFEACITTELGEPVMVGDTRLKCNDSAYSFHIIFAWVALFAFGIGIPLGVVWLVKYLKSRRLLNKGESLLRYGALYEWYNDKYAWFEAVSLARKGLMLLPITLMSGVMSQAITMTVITLLYAVVIVCISPFIRFPLKLKWIEREVDFYNFLEAITAVATGFDLLLGVLAEADTTREAASAIGVIFILVNSSIVVLAVASFEAGLHKSRKRIKKTHKEFDIAKLSEDSPRNEETEITFKVDEAVIEALSRPLQWSDVFKEQSNAAIYNDDDSEEEIKMVTNPSLRRGLSKFASSKKEFSLRAIGSKQSSMKDYGVRNIREQYATVLDLSDDECQELSERWFSEYVMMLEAKTNMHFGDAGAIKRQLQKTRARLLDEVANLITTCTSRTKEIEEYMQVNEIIEENEQIKAAMQNVAAARELHEYLTEFWSEPEAANVRRNYKELKAKHVAWLKDFHERLSVELQKETFESQSDGVIATKASALGRKHERKHKNDRRLSISFSASLLTLTKENEGKKDEVESETNRLLLICMDVDDFENAFLLEEHRAEVIGQYNHDVVTIQYGMEPSVKGKGELLVKLRSKQAQIILPRVGVASLLVATIVLITSVQAENTIELFFYVGCSQFLLGLLCVGLSRHYSKWFVVLLILGCFTQLRLQWMSFSKAYDLSTFRTFHTIDKKWRESKEYQEQYFKWGEAAVEAIQEGNSQNRFDWQLFPYDYECSEAVNVVVSNRTDVGQTSQDQVVEDDDSYVENFGVSHVYGKCASCASDDHHKVKHHHLSYDRRSSYQFDVALWEHRQGNNVSIHNCLYEMFVDRVSVVDDEKYVPGASPVKYTLPNPTGWEFPANFQDFFDIEDQTPFWDKNGHCRSDGTSLYWDNFKDGEISRPLAFDRVYGNLTAIKELNPNDYWYYDTTLPKTSGISKCTSCPDGFQFVVTGKENLEEPGCNSADGPTKDEIQNKGISKGSCTVKDSLKTMSTGVCVMAFNSKGDDAIKALREEAARAYADVHENSPDVAAGHTDTEDLATLSYSSPLVSLGRLETLWVASAYLTLLCYVLTTLTVALLMYSLRSQFFVTRLSGKVFKTAEDAVAVDHLKLFCILFFAAAVLLNTQATVFEGTSGNHGLEKNQRSLWCSKWDFVNTLNAYDKDRDKTRGNDASSGEDKSFLSMDGKLEQMDFVQNFVGEVSNREADDRQSWEKNREWFMTSKMFYMCDQVDDKAIFRPQGAYGDGMRIAINLLIPFFASVLHSISKLFGRISKTVTVLVEEAMLRLKVFGRGDQDSRCWLWGRRLLTLLLMLPIPILMAKALELEPTEERECNFQTSYVSDGNGGVTKDVTENCYIVVKNRGTSFMLPFLVFSFLELFIMLMGYHSFQTFFTLIEALLTFIMVVAYTWSYYLKIGWFFFNSTYGPYFEWEYGMFLALYIVPHAMAMVIGALKIHQFRLRLRTEAWLWTLVKQRICCCFACFCRTKQPKMEGGTEVVNELELVEVGEGAGGTV